jgi:hypothetical protein
MIPQNFNRRTNIAMEHNGHRYKRKLDWKNSMTKQRLNIIPLQMRKSNLCHIFDVMRSVANEENF